MYFPAVQLSQHQERLPKSTMKSVDIETLPLKHGYAFHAQVPDLYWARI